MCKFAAKSQLMRVFRQRRSVKSIALCGCQGDFLPSSRKSLKVLFGSEDIGRWPLHVTRKSRPKRYRQIFKTLMGRKRGNADDVSTNGLKNKMTNGISAHIHLEMLSCGKHLFVPERKQITASHRKIAA